MKPSDFMKDFPHWSVFWKIECEEVAYKIMSILEKTGDVFRVIPWKEYKKHRNEGCVYFEEKFEKECFDKVVPYCSTSQRAISFSPVWANLKIQIGESNV